MFPYDLAEVISCPWICFISPLILGKLHFPIQFYFIKMGMMMHTSQGFGFPDSSVGKKKKIRLQRRRPRFDPRNRPGIVWRRYSLSLCWRRDRLHTPVFLGFPCGLGGKESACNVGDLGSIPGLGRSPGEGKGYPLQYSALAWRSWGRKELDMTERLSLFRVVMRIN